jgi:predicted kinase
MQKRIRIVCDNTRMDDTAASLTVMYGPPAAGKTTYAESQTDAVIVDLEQLVIENSAGVGYAGQTFSSKDQWHAGKALAEEALLRG